MSSIVYYVIGYGLPTLTVIVLVLFNVITGTEMYLRRNDEDEVEICFLSVEAMPAIVVPAGQTVVFYYFLSHITFISPPGLVVLLNLAVTIKAVCTAYKAGKRR